jgi:hypothetical protein
MPKKKKEEGTSTEIKSTNKFIIRAKQNLFLPDGKFVGKGAEKKVGSAEKDFYLKTGKWDLLD